MKSFFVSVFAVGCVGVGAAQVQYVAYQDGKRVGDVVSTFKVDDEGKKTTDTRFTMSSGNLKITLVITAITDPTGAPVRRIQKLTLGDQAPVTTVIDFKADRATTVIDQKGHRMVQNHMAPTGASLKDPSEFWFVRDRPAPGATVKFTGFNSDTHRWDQVESTYLGKRTITIGDVKYDGFEIRVMRNGKPGTVVVNDKGEIIQLIDTSGLRLERVKS